MSKKPARPAGMPWLSPYLTVKDAQAALDFYQRAFGFEKKSAYTGPDNKTMHAEVTWRDTVVMFGPESGPGCEHGNVKAPVTTGVSSPVSLYVYCDDVDALFKRATAAGARVGMAPMDAFYGDRVCKLIDPDGHTWNFATHIADFDPAKGGH